MYIWRSNCTNCVVTSRSMGYEKCSERRKVNVLEIRCLRNLVDVSQLDRVRNEEVSMTARIERELASRAYPRILRWFWIVVRTDKYHMARTVLMAEVSGGRVRGRSRLGRMDDVMVAWATEGWRWRLRDMAGKIGKSGERWCQCNWKRATGPFLPGPVFFPSIRPWSGGYHLQRGGMPLYDAVVINCENGATTENQGTGVKYVG